MKVNIFWFRRDLRLDDNAGLYHALKQDKPVIPVFIFDKLILDGLEEKTDRRVEFIRLALEDLQEALVQKGASLEVYYGTPTEVFKKLLTKHNIEKVFTNHDYEPYAIKRDKEIQQLLKEHGVSLHTYKDQVIFEKNEVMKDNGDPYTVYTPYSKRWKATLNDFYAKSYPTEKYFHNFYKQPAHRIPSLKSMGFKAAGIPFPSATLDEDIVRKYDKQRDIPAINGTTHMGVHLRFGTVSIRQVLQTAQELNAVFMSELIWRDFFQSILWHFPKVGEGKAFKADYDFIKWRYPEQEFERWCKGTTGYPLVDAGMRQLNETGFMHNRVRMVTASFLSKHLLIDWRWGEAYFAEKLLDFDLAANNGNWQWAAGCGCDAAPYFRIFNPTLQTKRFDPQLHYIKKWVPELNTLDYPTPIIAHEAARKRCLDVYSKALKQPR
ncbi:deoxyribodipyrimidine photo-lyase [Chitinophaga rupis]|uniref:Deoxyribodipyrimidine photo-lyase n=1 Tax=Chitinophaga rupis TaxID=573321 RepID=A0A1H7WJ27_9BACT|nr:deoxyribodipyrimidine photo-lyase [Chitinophaga rupis]SEM21125.1 deoxyribodipyrimidine photo-lyase [Chitinophaga rupis]